MADGGEGTLDVLGGPNRTSTVTGPLGTPVEAAWRLDGRTAVIEMARASGLELVGGAAANDPVAASTAGTGELIVEAIDKGAQRVIVGLGGSATTDGGLAALRALHPLGAAEGRRPDRRVRHPRRVPRGGDLVRAAEGCDDRAGRAAAPPPGAAGAGVPIDDHGVDVLTLEGAGAAGGLAGGLAAAGARLVSGFDLVADEVHLDERIEGADLVVTAEGFLDALSFEGKVVGGVVGLAAALGVPVVAIAGQVFDDAGDRVEAHQPGGPVRRGAGARRHARLHPRRSWTTSSPGTRHDLRHRRPERGLRDRRPQPPRCHGAGRARPLGCGHPAGAGRRRDRARRAGEPRAQRRHHAVVRARP